MRRTKDHDPWASSAAQGAPLELIDDIHFGASPPIFHYKKQINHIIRKDHKIGRTFIWIRWMRYVWNNIVNAWWIRQNLLLQTHVNTISSNIKILKVREQCLISALKHFKLVREKWNSEGRHTKEQVRHSMTKT